LAVLIFQAPSTPLAPIMLNTGRLTAGRLPWGWQIKVNIDSQHTGTVAGSYFGEVACRSVPL
jgi:hypothetical protein